MTENEAEGRVTDYFWKRDTVRIEVLDGEISTGDELHITGEYTDLTLIVDEMTVEDESRESAEAGEIFAMPLEPQNRVVLGDSVQVVS